MPLATTRTICYQMLTHHSKDHTHLSDLFFSFCACLVSHVHKNILVAKLRQIGHHAGVTCAGVLPLAAHSGSYYRKGYGLCRFVCSFPNITKKAQKKPLNTLRGWPLAGQSKGNQGTLLTTQPRKTYRGYMHLDC